MYFKDKLDRAIQRAREARGPLKFIILNMAAVTDVDSTGLKTLREVLAEQKKAGAKVIFVDLSETVKSKGLVDFRLRGYVRGSRAGIGVQDLDR